MKGLSWSIFSCNVLTKETYASSDGMVDEVKFMVLKVDDDVVDDDD